MESTNLGSIGLIGLQFTTAMNMLTVRIVLRRLRQRFSAGDFLLGPARVHWFAVAAATQRKPTVGLAGNRAYVSGMSFNEKWHKQTCVPSCPTTGKLPLNAATRTAIIEVRPLLFLARMVFLFRLLLPLPIPYCV